MTKQYKIIPIGGYYVAVDQDTPITSGVIVTRGGYIGMVKEGEGPELLKANKGLVVAVSSMEKARECDLPYFEVPAQQYTRKEMIDFASYIYTSHQNQEMVREPLQTSLDKLIPKDPESIEVGMGLYLEHSGSPITKKRISTITEGGVQKLTDFKLIY